MAYLKNKGLKEMDQTYVSSILKLPKPVATNDLFNHQTVILVL
jgi:hypothetical protein